MCSVNVMQGASNGYLYKKGMLLVAALLEWEVRCASTKGLLKVVCLASRGGGVVTIHTTW